MISRIRELEGIVQYVQKLEVSDITYLNSLHAVLIKLFKAMEATDLDALPPSVKENIHTLLREKHALVDQTITAMVKRKSQLLDSIEKSDSLFDAPWSSFSPESFVAHQAMERGYLICFTPKTALSPDVLEKLLRVIRKNETDILGCFDKEKQLFVYHTSARAQSEKKLSIIQKKLLGKEVLWADYIRLPHWESEPEALQRFICESMTARQQDGEAGAYQMERRNEDAPKHGFLVDDGEEMPLAEEPEIGRKYDKSWLIFCRDKKNAAGIAKTFHTKFDYPVFGEAGDIAGESEQGRVFYYYTKQQTEGFFIEAVEQRLDFPLRIKQIYLDSEGFTDLSFLDLVEKLVEEFQFSRITVLLPSDKAAPMLQKTIDEHQLKTLSYSKALSVTK